MKNDAYKNWSAISALENWLLMELVAYADDREILTGLQQGFPQLFSKTPVTPRVPHRLLERLYGETQENEYDAMCSWLEACERIGIPLAYRWTSMHDTPQEIVEQVKAFWRYGRLFTGSLLTLQGRRLIAVTTDACPHVDDPDNPPDNWRGVTRYDIDDLAVVDEQHIDFSLDDSYPRLPSKPYRPRR